ncbi:MAG TPA: hypothetical protein VF395_01460, partial [Polyangiaceae bacterium]
IVPRHEIRHSQRAPSSQVAQAPMHFPCIVCQKPSFGNVCPCCEGYVCPAHQAGRDEWCTTCTRAYRSSLEDSALRPIDKAALGLGGLALAATAAAGAAATAPDAVANLVVGPGLALLLAGIVFTVGRSSYLRARFVNRRRNAGLSAPSAPRHESTSERGTPAPEASADIEIMAPEATLASPFEKRLDAMLTPGAGESPLSARAWPGAPEVSNAPIPSEFEDLGRAATTIAPSLSPSGGRELSPATMEAALPRVAEPSEPPPAEGSEYPAIEFKALLSVQKTETEFLPLEALRREEAARALSVAAAREAAQAAVRSLATLPVTSGRSGNGVAQTPLEALPMVRLEALPEASASESASFLVPRANARLPVAPVPTAHAAEDAPGSSRAEIVERTPMNTSPAFAAVSCQIQPKWYPCIPARVSLPDPGDAGLEQSAAAEAEARAAAEAEARAAAEAEQARAAAEAEETHKTAEAVKETFAAEALAVAVPAPEAPVAVDEPRAADSLPSIPFAEALLSLPSIVVTVAPPAPDPLPAALASPGPSAPVVASAARGDRAYGGALSIPPNAFDDEPDRSRRGKGGRSGASGAQAARRARYG